jgi:hypothetical protein
MNQLTAELIQAVRAKLSARYPSYKSLPTSEKVLLAMSVLTADFKIRERTNRNDGTWVKGILGSVGLGEGFAWCAAGIKFCTLVADARIGPQTGAAGVASWVAWGKRTDRLIDKPIRGALCYFVNKNGTGHMGIVSGMQANGDVISYEANTQPGESGDQRDGGGCYRRVRKPSVWDGYIELD